jgi:peptidoglycan/LPS O-acetylase OafA/YrhL
MNKISLNLVNNDNQASRILDVLRFLSALTVFLFHFYVPLPGYQAVMVFFVLSGYFISSSVLKAAAENRWSWPDYLIKRITRLWIVLLPALILTLIWATIQLGLFGEDLSPPNLRISDFISWKMFFGNLFFMQGILVKPFGLNGPLWSLSYEFWYYILFPCLVLLFRPSKKRKKVFYALVIIAISIIVGHKIMEYFLVWLLGAIIPLIKSLKLKKAYLKNVIFGFSVLLAIFSMHYEAGSSFFLDLRVGITFALLAYLVVSFFNDNRGYVRFNIPKHLAGFSYTLYLTHYPLANFILTWRLSPLWVFHGNSLLIKAALALLVFGYAWIIASFTEKHTDRVRKLISNLIFRKNVKQLNFTNL